MNRILLFALTFNFFNSAISQEKIPCGTSLLLSDAEADLFYLQLNERIQNLTENSGDRATHTIPVVFHIVYNSAAENIDDSLILQQMQILNDDFNRWNADTVNTPAAFEPFAGALDIEFCLAQVDTMGNPTSGILRIPTAETSFDSPVSYAVPDPVKHTLTGGSDAWDTEHYMNIWICNLSGSTAYTAPPGNFAPADDGIVCHYNHIGNSGVAPYDKGRSIVHEMGHWFCLKHIWGDDAGGCGGTDFIADTPNQANWTGGCPSFPLTDACTAASPGVMYMNYMDYSEDGCRNMFSAGQVAYMESCITAVMATYFDEDKCTSVVGINGASNALQASIESQQLTISSDRPMKTISLFDTQGKLVGSWEAGFSDLFTVPVSSPEVLLVLVVSFDDNSPYRQLLIAR